MLEMAKPITTRSRIRIGR